MSAAFEGYFLNQAPSRPFAGGDGDGEAAGGGFDAGGFAGGEGLVGADGSTGGGVIGFGVVPNANDESSACKRPLYSPNRDGEVTYVI